MAVLEKLLKSKLPSGGDLSKKLLKGKLFTKRGAKPADGEAEAPLPTQGAKEEAQPPEKPKKPSIADKAKSAKSLFKGRNKGPEAYGGPSTDRIAKALRRDQLEPAFDFEPPPRIFASGPEAEALLPRPVPDPAPDTTLVAVPPEAVDEAVAPATAPSQLAVLTGEEVAAALAAVTAPVVEAPPAPKPVPEPRSAAFLALKTEIELDVPALVARVEHRTGAKVEITQEGQDLQLSFEGASLLICHHPHALSEAELVNLLVPDEQEWQILQARFASMGAHMIVGAPQHAESLSQLRQRTILMAGVVVALLDLIPTCLGTIWPLGAALIEESDFRDLATALATPAVEEPEPPVEVEEVEEPQQLAVEMAAVQLEILPNPQPEEPPAPRT